MNTTHHRTADTRAMNRSRAQCHQVPAGGSAVSRRPAPSHRPAATRPADRSRRAAPRTGSQPPYGARRLTVALVAALAVATSIAAVTAIGGPAASASSPADVAPRRTVIAQPGDTLWDLAAEHRGDVSITRYVDKLVELNGGASIDVGQTITLP